MAEKDSCHFGVAQKRQRVITHPTRVIRMNNMMAAAVYIWSGECHTNKDGSVYPELFHEDTWGGAMNYPTLKHIKFKKRR